MSWLCTVFDQVAVITEDTSLSSPVSAVEEREKADIDDGKMANDLNAAYFLLHDQKRLQLWPVISRRNIMTSCIVLIIKNVSKFNIHAHGDNPAFE